jgi:tRNA pseudouridine55 synthase
MNHGVINVLKPPGMTSHDVVGFLRRVIGTKRVGHTGTLDPAAAGVLPICVGQATRLVEYLQAGSKEYIAEATFGYETDTLDAAGKVLLTGDTSAVTLDALRAALDPLRGEIEQTPPLYSAIKQDGKKLYELARAGVENVEIPTRRVTISGLHPTRFVAGDESTLPRAMLHIECGGGTYIRSLVRDAGRTLGCGATMTFLVRTRSGGFHINKAHTVEAIQNDWQSTLIPMTTVLGWCALEVIIDDEAIERLAKGQRVAKPVNNAFLNEYKENPEAAKQRRTAAWQQLCDDKLLAFFNSSRTVAAIVSSDQEKPSLLKPEKVFFLDKDD